MTRIAIDVETAQDQERNYRSCADSHAELTAACRILQHHSPERIACGHHSDPRNDRVENHQLRTDAADAKLTAHVHDLPEPAEQLVGRHVPRIGRNVCKQIVTDDHQHAERTYP